jgi:hypothetical protein
MKTRITIALRKETKMAIAKLTRKEAEALWDLITNAQSLAWQEGRKFGDDGGPANANPYPRTGTAEDLRELYKLLRGIR